MINMLFDVKYPTLSDFLGAWFPDSDFEGKSDEEIVNDFIKVSSDITLKKVLEEIEEAKTNINDIWEEIIKESNMYFSNSEDTLNWLESIEKIISVSIQS
jgi:hypothetical protein